MRRIYSILASTVFVMATGFLSTAQAANILYVHDHAPGDDNIVTVLEGDGHTVTPRVGGYNSSTDINTDLTMGVADLNQFDSVFWNATAGGSGDFHAAAQFTDLLAYVEAGGRVFVTGYDTVASPGDTHLVAFLGGTGSADFGSPNAPVTGDNNLSMGMIDIRGITPTGAWGDKDTIFGADCVVTSSSGGCSWSLRTLGTGEIAYISAGASSSSVEAAWVNTSAGGAGAYNAALRNFAAAQGFETATYSSDRGSIRINGVKCDTRSERNLDASLFFEYNIGPNAGTWESSFFNGNQDDDSDWEDESNNGIFTTFDSMEAKSMSHSWYDYMDFESLLSDFGHDNCDNFGYDSFRHGETVVKTFIANINKRRSTADVRMRGSAFWNEDTAQERLRRILFDYRARMNLEEEE